MWRALQLAAEAGPRLRLTEPGGLALEHLPGDITVLFRSVKVPARQGGSGEAIPVLRVVLKTERSTQSPLSW